MTKLAQLSGKLDVSITQQINTLADERQKLSEGRAELVSALQQARTIIAGATADGK